ncbi:MAG: riboflavin synthase [Cetobacterium sp.]
MFTGLVEEIGKIVSIEITSEGAKVVIACNLVLKKANLGDSICTNGVCLTIVQITSKTFTANIMNESLKVSTFKNLKSGDLVNLEKSLTLESYLGGHLVTGDVDCYGKIIDIINDGFTKKYIISIPNEFMRYIVYKGRITLDGASLTIASLTETDFTVCLIPHTQKSITLGSKNIGDHINIETDLIAKHLEKLILNKVETNIKSKSIISKEFLAQNGFL